MKCPFCNLNAKYQFSSDKKKYSCRSCKSSGEYKDKKLFKYGLESEFYYVYINTEANTTFVYKRAESLIHKVPFWAP